MATVERDAAIEARPGIAARLRALVSASHRAATRRKLVRRRIRLVSRLDAYLLWDIGIDPEEVRPTPHGWSLSVLFNPVYRRHHG